MLDFHQYVTLYSCAENLFSVSMNNTNTCKWVQIKMEVAEERLTSPGSSKHTIGKPEYFAARVAFVGTSAHL